MTLTILASVSLLALVSTARPLPRVNEEWNGLQITDSHESAEIEHAIQAVFKSRGRSLSNVDKNDINVHLVSVEEVQAYLSNIDETSVEALVQLKEEELKSPDQKELYEILSRLETERGRRTPIPDEALDSLNIESPSNTSSNLELNASEEPGEISAPLSGEEDTRTSMPVFIMVVSCVVSLLAFACIATTLYIVELLKANVLRSQTAWDILSQLEKDVLKRNPNANDVANAHRGAIEVSEKDTVDSASANFLRIPLRLSPFPPSTEISGKPVANPTDSDDGIDDEKFYDAESSTASTPYSTPLLRSRDLPTDMSEVPTARPSWSVRATEAKLPTVDTRPMAEIGRARGNGEGRRRAFAAAPELDAALAMQLRPGFGIGADAAWLVRFVMALFGWCAVLISGGASGRRG